MSEITIKKRQENEKLIVSVGGRIDTVTSPQLDTEVKGALEGVDQLYLDFGEVSYISSSGLRVLLSLHKVMDSKGGKLVIGKPSEMVLEVFDVTGFADVLNIEK